MAVKDVKHKENIQMHVRELRRDTEGHSNCSVPTQPGVTLFCFEVVIAHELRVLPLDLLVQRFGFFSVGSAEDYRGVITVYLSEAQQQYIIPDIL